MSASGLAAHLSPAELGQRYRAARSPIERSHLRIVWLPSRGRGEREVARVTGHGRRWVGEVARRYDEGGPDGLGDRRRRNVGAKPLLVVWPRDVLGTPDDQHRLGQDARVGRRAVAGIGEPFALRRALADELVG